MTVSTRPRGLPRRAPKSDRSFTLVDLTGGLDLYRDGTQLEPNFSSEMMNVDPLIGGGVRRRKGVTIYSPAEAPGLIDSLNVHTLGTGTNAGWQVPLASIAGTMYRVSKQGYTSAVAAASPSSVWRSFQVYNKSYLYDSGLGVEACRSFTTARNATPTVSTLATGFNATSPKYGTYTNTGVPVARSMAFWHGRCWAAATLESTVAYNNRIRWSFPIVNNIGAEDWHPDDYLTSDETGEIIHSLVPQGDRLLIFKPGSVDQITGWDETNFVRTTVLHDAGAVSPDAITVLGGQVYFWDIRLGLCRFTSEGFDVVATRILPLVQKVAPKVAYDVTIAPGVYKFGPSLSLAAKPQAQVYLGAVQDRIWCSVGYLDDNLNAVREVLVYDPKLGQGKGGWLKYDLQVGPFVTSFKEGWEQYGLDYLAGSRDTSLPYRLLSLEIPGQEVDDFGVALRSIPSRYRSAWMADNTPFQRKRWGLTQAILDGGAAQSFSVEVYSDWDSKTIRDSLTYSNPDTPSATFKVNLSLMAPTRYERKRPAGLAGSGANALYLVPATSNTATWDDITTTYDSADRDWEGNYFVPTTENASSELYFPVVPQPSVCEPASAYPRLTGASRVGFEFQTLVMPVARAVQFLVVGALPSKEWALRGIMVTYREVE